MGPDIATLNYKNKLSGKTTLHQAIKYDRPEITSLLLNKGADPNLPDPDGWTSLHFAVVFNNAKLVELKQS